MPPDSSLEDVLRASESVTGALDDLEEAALRAARAFERAEADAERLEDGL